MKIPIFQVDAFASKGFRGNPAAVCLLEEWLNEDLMQAIANENNLSETAFIVHKRDGFEIRWFTPTTEVALCGHATLASAFVVFHHTSWKKDKIRFYTRKKGELVVSRTGNRRLTMDFPSQPATVITPQKELSDALGVCVKEVLRSSEDLLVVVDNEEMVRNSAPNWMKLNEIECRGCILTSKGNDCDFVSRFFAPRVGVLEDPVTGSAHTVLVPYWANELRKNTLHAFQLSKRGGELWCNQAGDRVYITGDAVLYMQGTLFLNQEA
jgi:PhzF family phenazine biosynthesis protein